MAPSSGRLTCSLLKSYSRSLPSSSYIRTEPVLFVAFLYVNRYPFSLLPAAIFFSSSAWSPTVSSLPFIIVVLSAIVYVHSLYLTTTDSAYELPDASSILTSASPKSFACRLIFLPSKFMCTTFSLLLVTLYCPSPPFI